MSEGLLTTPVEGGAPATEAPAAAAPAAPSWRDSIAEDLRADPSLTKFSTLDDLAKSYKHLERSFGSNKISIPSEHATEDDWKQVYRKLGQPEKLEDYKIKVPKDSALDGDFVKQFSENAFKAGVLPKQAEQLLGWYHQAVQADVENQKQALEHQSQQVVQDLKKEWGMAFNEKVMRAQAAVKEFGGDELVSFLNETGLGNNPVLVKLFAKLGDLTKEDNVPGRERAQGAMTPSEAMEKARSIMADKEHPFNIVNHPNHEKALSEMQRIYELAYPDQDG